VLENIVETIVFSLERAWKRFGATSEGVFKYIHVRV